MSSGPACHACGAAWNGGKPEFRALCAGCSAWVHACRNCIHFDLAVHHECRAAATAEYVADKDKFNFCEEFAFRAGGAPGTGRGTKSRADIEKLFPGLP